MPRTTCPAVNKRLRSLGYPDLRLRGGRGYQYFTYSDGARFEDRSEMVYRVSDLTVDEWVERALDFARDLGVTPAGATLATRSES